MIPRWFLIGKLRKRDRLCKGFKSQIKPKGYFGKSFSYSKIFCFLKLQRQKTDLNIAEEVGNSLIEVFLDIQLLDFFLVFLHLLAVCQDEVTGKYFLEPWLLLGIVMFLSRIIFDSFPSSFA